MRIIVKTRFWAGLILVAILGIPLGTSIAGTNPQPGVQSETVEEQRRQAVKTKSDAAAPDADRHYFFSGYEHYSHRRYDEAAASLFEYLKHKTSDDEYYEWSDFFFGISLKRMGLSHAAVDSLTHVVTRKPNPKIVGYSLEVLEAISRELPFDRDMLINRALCDQSYDFVDPTIADFVHYYQGEYDWEHGLFAWGDAHFRQLRPNGYYYNKYLFMRALREIAADQIDRAVKTLKTVLRELPDGNRLKDDVRKTLARLYYEKGKFTEADFLYSQIEMNIVDQAQNLLERAWVQYRMGNLERAMGLLYSFQAPSFSNSFTPEFYILKSFIYKDVCHYQAALQVLDRFRIRYGESLDHIYQRSALKNNQAMLLVILNKPWINWVWTFLERLELEQRRIAKIDHPELAAYLNNLYDLKQTQYKKRFRRLVRDEYEKMANTMLRFEEEAHLLEYEIGTDMYQRISAFTYKDDPIDNLDETSNAGLHKAIYEFQGEFWNDELDDYEVALPNKCDNLEEWHIFFK